MCGGQAGEAGGMLIDAGKGSSPASRRDSKLAGTAQGGTAEGSARRVVGSLWAQALQEQKRGEAEYLRKQAAREQEVATKSGGVAS